MQLTYLFGEEDFIVYLTLATWRGQNSTNRNKLDRNYCVWYFEDKIRDLLAMYDKSGRKRVGY